MTEPLPPHVPLGMRLVQLRRRFNLSQAALANKAGLTRRTIEYLEREETRRPRQTTLSKLAAALGMSLVEVERVLGLVSLSAPVDMTVPVQAIPIGGHTLTVESPYSQRAQRVAMLMDDLRPDQQDLLESYVLQLQSQRDAVLPQGRRWRSTSNLRTTGVE